VYTPYGVSKEKRGLVHHDLKLLITAEFTVLCSATYIDIVQNARAEHFGVNLSLHLFFYEFVSTTVTSSNLSLFRIVRSYGIYFSRHKFLLNLCLTQTAATFLCATRYRLAVLVYVRGVI